MLNIKRKIKKLQIIFKMKKEKDNTPILIYILFVIIVGSFFMSFGFEVGEAVGGYFKIYTPIPINSTAYLNCSNMALEQTAVCLRDFVSTFYKYNVRSDHSRTISDIIKNGGDCHDYSKLYEGMALELGFDADTMTHDALYKHENGLGEKILSAHRWAIIWDGDKYCKLDQLLVSCGERG